MGIYGYGRNPTFSNGHLHLSSAKSLLKIIDENFATLVFCRRYLDRLGLKRYLLGVSQTVSAIISLARAAPHHPYAGQSTHARES
jgi:methionyl aminopeptidase